MPLKAFTFDEAKKRDTLKSSAMPHDEQSLRQNVLTCEAGCTEEPEFWGAEILLEALDRPDDAKHRELAYVLVASLFNERRHTLHAMNEK